MDWSLNKEQIKKLEAISQLFLDMERDHQEGMLFDSLLLEELIARIKILNEEESLLLKKLSESHKHLSPKMSLRHFVSLAVPFERAIKRHLQDDDFLVSTSDNDHKVVPRVPLIFVIENMRSAFNVGACFRTAECLGAEKILLTGYTASPIQSKVEKTAMGTGNFVLWESVSSTLTCIQKLKAQGYFVVAIETSPSAKSYTESYVKKPTAFVFGNERFGLEADVLKACDEVRSIPVFGVKNSLNVGIAAGIIGYEWRRQYGF